MSAVVEAVADVGGAIVGGVVDVVSAGVNLATTVATAPFKIAGAVGGAIVDGIGAIGGAIGDFFSGLFGGPDEIDMANQIIGQQMQVISNLQQSLGQYQGLAEAAWTGDDSVAFVNQLTSKVLPAMQLNADWFSAAIGGTKAALNAIQDADLEVASMAEDLSGTFAGIF